MHCYAEFFIQNLLLLFNWGYKFGNARTNAPALGKLICIEGASNLIYLEGAKLEANDQRDAGISCHLALAFVQNSLEFLTKRSFSILYASAK